MESKLGKEYKESMFTQIIPNGDGEYLFFNSFSGIFVSLNKEVLDFYNETKNGRISRELSSEEAEALKFFTENRILIDPELDEAKNASLQCWKAKFSTDILYLSLMPTLECNFKCKYCFEEEKNLTIGSNVEKSIISFLEQKLPAHRALHLDWYGGEPLMQSKKMLSMTKTIKEVCKSNNVIFSGSATTNGYLLTSEVSRQLVELGIKNYQITIDGIKDVHDSMRVLKSGDGTFDQIINNIKQLPDGAELNLRINVSPKTLEGVTDLIDLIHDNNIKGCTLHVKPILPSKANPCDDLFFSTEEFAKKVLPIYEYGMQKEYRFDFISQLFSPKFKFCIVDTNSQFIVTPDAKLYKCTDSFNDCDCVGALSEGGEIKLEEKSYMRWLDKDVLSIPECATCNALPLCGGGCIMKRLEGVDTPCSEFRHNLPELLKLVYRFPDLVESK